MHNKVEHFSIIINIITNYIKIMKQWEYIDIQEILKYICSSLLVTLRYGVDKCSV